MSSPTGPSQGLQNFGNKLKNNTKSFNDGAGRGSRDDFLYWLIWAAILTPEKFDTPAHFAEAVAKEIPEGFLDSKDPEFTNFMQKIDEIEAFATNPADPLREKKAGEIADHFIQRFNIPPSISSKPDPTFAKALMEALSTYKFRRLPSDSTQLSLADKIADTLRAVDEYNNEERRKWIESKKPGHFIPLNGVEVATQIKYESGYDRFAKSKAGALGIAQIMPGTGKDYGLITTADFYDPHKAIKAMVHHMGDLTQRFGSQEVALAAYNGGGGAVQHVMDKLNKSSVTAEDLLSYWGEQRKTVSKSGAWCNETYTYMRRIIGTTQSAEQMITAVQSSAPKTTQLAGMFGQVNATAPQLPGMATGYALAGNITDNSKPEPIRG